jgi:hypothetical protein
LSCSSQAYSGRDSSNISWANWSGRVVGPVSDFFEPDSLPDLVNIVVRAAKGGHQIRVVGSGWAFENIAYSPDWMVSMVRLNRRLMTVTGSALNAQWAGKQAPGSNDALFHMEAGASIADVNDALSAAGLALPTMGGANGQGLSGAISTSTHGGDISLPPFPDLVMAMHLVTADGREVWVERASQPITEDVPLAMALACADAEILRDDALFDALLVGFGRFGIIYSYVLRVGAAFRLAEWTVQIPRTVLTAQLRLGVAQRTFIMPLLAVLPDPPPALGALDVKNPRGLEVVFDTQNLGNCWVKRRWVTAVIADLHVDDTPNALCVLGAAGVLAAGLTALSTLEATPPWVLIPGFPVGVELKKGDLSGSLLNNPLMTAGEMLARVMTAFWDLNAGLAIPPLAASEFSSHYKDSTADGIRGVSHLVLSGSRDQSLQTCFRVDSIEPIFDAHNGGYIDFLDAILGAAPNSKQAGSISLRWSATSKATLSMHNFASPNAVAIEITSLRGLPDNASWMTVLESLAIGFGGRPHWGQINTLNAALVSQLYGGNLQTWRAELTALTGGSIAFSSAHTLQRGLEPTNPGAKPTLIGLRAGDLATGFQPAIFLLLS